MKNKNRIIAPYAIGGGVASSVAYNMMMVFFMYYSTDIFKINAATVGVIMLISRLVDTVTDPLMGSIADKTSTKYGRYRFWLLVSAPMVFLATILIFLTPPIASESGRTMYMLVMYILFSIVYTIPNIAFHSLSSYLSDDVKERQSIVFWKQAVGQLAALFVSAGGYYIIDKFGGGTAGYRALGVSFGIIIMVGYWICARGVAPIDTEEKSRKHKNVDNNISIFKSMSFVVTNRSLLTLSIASATNTFALAVTGATGIYFYKVVLQNGELFAVASFFNTAMIGVGYVVMLLLIKKFSNRDIFIWSSAIGIIPSVILYFFFNENPVYVLGMLGIAFGITQVAFLGTWMMVTDCADDIRHQTKQDGDGISAAGLNFANKLGLAFGGLFAGILVSYIGYVPGQVEQSPETINGLIFSMTMLPALGNVFSVVAMKWYPITKEYHENILAEMSLEENKTESTEDMLNLGEINDILVICNEGITSYMLTKSLQGELEKIDANITVSSHSINDEFVNVHNWDLCLLTPQVGYKKAELESVLNCPVKVITANQFVEKDYTSIIAEILGERNHE